jgi:hypothetical protein
MEEVGAVLRRGLSVLCSFGGLEYCGVGAPFGLSLHTNSALRPTAKPEEVSPPPPAEPEEMPPPPPAKVKPPPPEEVKLPPHVDVKPPPPVTVLRAPPLNADEATWSVNLFREAFTKLQKMVVHLGV